MNEKLQFINLQLFAGEEKTEEATPHRKRESRKKGQVARSSDLNAAIVIVAMIASIYLLRGYFFEKLNLFINTILGNELNLLLTDNQLLRVYRIILDAFLGMMAPVFLIAIVCGLTANFIQIGFLFAPEAIKPKLSNINPIEGFKKIFSKRALVEFLKALLKITIVGIVVYNVLRSRARRLLFLTDMEPAAIGAYLANFIFQVALYAAIIFLVIALLDFLYQKWDFKRNIRMSKHEVKQEFKQTEGDPLIKSKLKERQRQLAMGRMMESIPEATVVVTNPTHLAIALKYEEDELPAPQVIAKGAGFIAEKIKEKAKEHKIPIIENKPVARALYKNVEIGEMIPIELYQAVAEILAAIYSLKRK